MTIGGSVMTSRKGVPRVVWRRERKFSAGGVYDFIPFLSVSRSLGDFWSFNPRTNQFTVSPKPDVHVHPLDPKEQQFVVIASDGLWNVMSPDEVVRFIWDYEHDNQKCHQPRDVVKALINEALRKWAKRRLPADNIAVLIAFLSESEDSPVCSSLEQSMAPVSADSDEAASIAREVSPCEESHNEAKTDSPASPCTTSSDNNDSFVDYQSTETHRVDRVLRRSVGPALKLFPPGLGKRGRNEEDESTNGDEVYTKRLKSDDEADGLSEAILDDDSGVCSDDNMSQPNNSG